VHDAVDFIKVSLGMRARTPLREHLVLVSPIGEDDFSNAARLVATLFGTHRSDPQQFETQGSLAKDAVKYDARYLRTAKLRFFWVWSNGVLCIGILKSCASQLIGW
jgi:hypothetical protein